MGITSLSPILLVFATNVQNDARLSWCRSCLKDSYLFLILCFARKTLSANIMYAPSTYDIEV